MGTPLKNPPVYFTLAQVAFNPVLKLPEFIPTIQEAMRQSGYPDFRADKKVAIELRVQDGRPTPFPVPFERFLFGNVGQTHCFILGTAFLTLQSTKYGRFEDFSAIFMKGLELLHSTVTLDFTERIGLRYLDHVAPRAGEDLSQYLEGEVLGLSARLNGTPVHAYSETLTKVDNMMLLSRVAIQEGGLALPPDLSLEGMAIAQRFLDRPAGKQATLDNDGYVEAREVFDVGAIANRLGALHDVIGGAFRAESKPHAFNVWDEK